MPRRGDPAAADRLLAAGDRLRRQCRELRTLVEALVRREDGLEDRDCADHLRTVRRLRREISSAVNQISRARADARRLPAPSALRLRRTVLVARRMMDDAAGGYGELAHRLSGLLESTGRKLRDLEKGQRVLQRYRQGAS